MSEVENVLQICRGFCGCPRDKRMAIYSRVAATTYHHHYFFCMPILFSLHWNLLLFYNNYFCIILMISMAVER